MLSISACWGLLGWAALCVVACNGSAGDLFSPVGDSAGTTGFGGRGGRGGSSNGVGGEDGAGAGGEAGGLDGGLDAAAGVGADGGVGCDDGCDDGNDCTVDICDGGVCSNAPAAAGAACGSDRDDACTAPDSCDGNGECLPNDAENGSACAEGSCTLGECVQGQPVGCPALVVNGLPFATGWSTAGKVDLYGGAGLYNGVCDNEDGTPDFALVFTAPAAGIYRFEAAGEVGGDGDEADSVIEVAAGACGGFEAEPLGCSDDIQNPNNLDSSLDLELAEGQTVTLYVNEYGETEPGAGSGTVSVSIAPSP